MCFSPYLGVFFFRGGPKGAGKNSNLYSSEMEISKTEFSCVLTFHNGKICHVKHVLDHIHVLFTLFGGLDRGKGLGHNLLSNFPLSAAQKWKFSKLIFLMF